MRTNMRARQLAFAALCAGSSIGAAGLIVAPGQALAATVPPSCSTIYGSGSTLQNIIQQNVFTQDAGPGKAFSKCASTPNVYYNTNSSGTNGSGTGSGLGLAEFALGADPNTGNTGITPGDSSNTKWLDGFIGTDDPPSSDAMQTAQGDADSNPEPVPVVQAPIAIMVNLPAGCTISVAPTFLNQDLQAAFANDASTGDTISWFQLLSDAGAKPVGCSNSTDPTVQVRSDSSGTSYATKQYFDQIDSSEWDGYDVDQPTWPGAYETTYGSNNTPDKGSGGEVAAVNSTVGSIGYANTANAAADFADWTKSSGSKFWVKVQNNGTATSGKFTGANPDTSKLAGNCSSTYAGSNVPSGDMPDYTGVHVANPKTAKATSYPLCTLTYDVAWSSYSGSSVLAPDYTNQYSGETPSGVALSTKDFLSYVVNAGQSKVATGTSYYTKLPTAIATAAKATVKDYVGQN